LDEDENGLLSFEEMLLKIIPGSSKDHVSKMMKWVNSEIEITDKALHNYRLPFMMS
jgi:hypothetical protein